MKKKHFSGFSLTEILISAAVILALAIFSLLFIPKQITKAKDARIKTNLHQIYMALEDYYDSSSSFPESLPTCGEPLINNGHVYLPSIPCSPFDNSNYFYQSGSDNAGKWFKIYSKLGNSDDNIIVLVGCSQGCGPECQYNYGASSTNTSLDRCLTPTPTQTPIKYACSPGNNKCDQYDDPVMSQCPKVYENDPTCNNECSIPANRCKNASGKHKPE